MLCRSIARRLANHLSTVLRPSASHTKSETRPNRFQGPRRCSFCQYLSPILPLIFSMCAINSPTFLIVLSTRQAYDQLMLKYGGSSSLLIDAAMFYETILGDHRQADKIRDTAETMGTVAESPRLSSLRLGGARSVQSSETTATCWQRQYVSKR